MQKHTPGPWEVITPKIGASITIYAKNGQVPIATTCSNTSPKTLEMHRSGEVKANADLMAAAPELLASLKKLQALLFLHTNVTDNEAMDAMQASRAVIAKATGVTL